MAKAKTIHACSECGHAHPRWAGRCAGCGAWGTLVEEAPASDAPIAAGEDLLSLDPSPGATKPVRLRDVDARSAPRLETGMEELDRVLGGGLVPGSVVLLGGEPGIGKSTLCLQLARGLGNRGPVLYVTGEESLEQVRLRAERLEALPDTLLALPETRVEALAEPWRELRPSLVLVDSIQTMRCQRVESAPGSVAQVRECAALLAATAKAHGTALVLVGHVTKEGSLAGPRVLEHLVDAVLTFEGERGHAFRLLRANKNRFGSTDEVGVFTMGESGLSAVENPSEHFLAERRAGAPGSCIVPVMEGSRPMLVEVQALVAPAGYGTARRTCLGIDDARVSLLLAVLDRRTDVDLLSCDVYVNVAGGMRIAEPAADLAVALALVSSRLDLPLPRDAAVFGEIGLGGEVRRVGRSEPRILEATRLGFERLLLPEGSLPERTSSAAGRGGGAVAAADVASAVSWLRAQSPGPGPETAR